MRYILGVDVGSNSLGIAVKFIDNQRFELFSYVFQEGVARTNTGAEKPLNEKRRLSRQVRRQFFRRRLRKLLLARKLSKHAMFPKLENGQTPETALRQIVLPEPLRDFFRLDAYALRDKAAKGDKLELLELGRVFYHLAQRRGYDNDLREDPEDSKTMFEGKAEEGKVGIQEVQKGVQQQGTLGQYLNSIPDNERKRNRYTLRTMYYEEFEKIWEEQQKHHPELLTDELKQELGVGRNSILFYQRPLRSQKKLRGQCSIYSNKLRTGKSNPLFEKFRALEVAQNLRITEGGEERNLDEKELTTVYDMLLSSASNVKPERIAKKLKVAPEQLNFRPGQTIAGSPFHAQLAKALKKQKQPLVPGKQFAKVGLAGVELKPKELLEDTEALLLIWNMFTKFDLKSYVRRFAVEQLGLTDEAALTDFLKLKLADGYAAYSTKALRQLLHLMQQGYSKYNAEQLVNVMRVFGSEWNKFSEQKQEEILKAAAAAAAGKGGKEARESIKEVLKASYELPEQKAELLLYPSERNKPEQAAVLPPPPQLRNPMVMRSLSQLRKHVNEIVRLYGAPEKISLELGRELRKSAKGRAEDDKRMRANERENDEARMEINKLNLTPNHDRIRKYKLWKEAKETCVYSGKKIPLADLFDTNTVEIEHIIPRDQSDNRMSNLTVSLRTANQEKGKRIPYEAFGHDEQRWQAMTKNAWRIWGQNNKSKAQFFCKKEHPERSEMRQSQLAGTQWVAREARSYLEHVCKEVQLLSGGVVAELRHLWGLNSLLNPPVALPAGTEDGTYYAALNRLHELADDEAFAVKPYDVKQQNALIKKLQKQGLVQEGRVAKETFYPSHVKNRGDHRHHALDALVMCFVSQGTVQKVNEYKSRSKQVDKRVAFPLPWPNFRNDVKRVLDAMLINHEVDKRVLTDEEKNIEKDGEKHKARGHAARGQLHEETYYGRRKAPKQEKHSFHIRKSLSAITENEINNIVDERVRVLVKEALGIFGDNPVPKKHLDKHRSKLVGFDEEQQKPITHVHLPNKNGEPIPVYKVRIAKASSNAVQLKDEVNRWVEPGNNHHVAIYKDAEGKLHEQVVTFWEAVEREKQGLPAIAPHDEQGRPLEVSLQANELFLLGYPKETIDWSDKSELSKYLYRVQKLSSSDYFFRFHLAANIDVPHEVIRVSSFKAWKKLKLVKVLFDQQLNLKPA